MRRSRNFCQGGSRSYCQKTALTTLFFLNFFLVLNLFYSGLSMVYFKENYNFPRFQRGSNIFQGGEGVQLFPGGVYILICIETHRTCDFPGGSRSPIPPLDPHLVGTQKNHLNETFILSTQNISSVLNRRTRK